MIIVLKKNIHEAQRESLRSFLENKGYTVKEIIGQEETVFGAVGQSGLDIREVEMLDGVASVVPISKPYKLASRELKKEDTIVTVGNVKIGGNRIAVMAGPCAIESREQISTIAGLVREAGAVILRGGAFKPRTSPYAFQGLGEEGLQYLKEAGEKYGMPVTTEIVSPSDVDLMKNYIDMFQIGARNMQNFELLKAVGKTGMPVLLKRGLCATLEEWLMAAEYLMASGTDQIVLCERGIRTFERATRNTLDCSAIPVVQKMTHLPVIGDPSHATGLRDMVNPMSLAIVASGASGLIVEVHDHPEKAFSDGPQSLYPSQFEKLMRDIQALAPVVGKSLERIPRIIPSSLTQKQGEAYSTFNQAIAFQGERGAYSELAVRRAFDEKSSVLPCKSFADVFDAVMQGKAAYGVVPVENTLGGTINDNLDLLISHPGIQVVGEQQVRIIHNLIVLPGTKKEQITHIYSHPQGLAQCADFLKNEMPWAEAVPFFDTAGSVSFVKKTLDPTKAAIAGAPAARFHDMEILSEGIESNPRNYTRFYIICREENASLFRSAAPVNRASLQFTVGDHPGALFEALSILSKHGLNMKKLESRPIPGKPWEYSFFVETELGEEGAFTIALDELKGCCSSARVLGTFTAAL
ncbi:phospho-2-dehydro-3-deoxyheptonate aldolase [Sphaerochaeta pleomorpha str. Grapes]|uniref:Phospho-2-dehydro-3-deoxyheptonate aldolase n=1 Tax=Sphaerochaeta pleomorpha (strain ATCC BAA-1885 / DSM 22778 / Grapes) TaxID=158190 RepID=G8QYP9_SPHPG|nr:3-deoxy-7-phosphoheptulonate synthase [Sphaerochaeta pleomorpha]AEV29676.1 phospho-2-dehydro-3-deoxyheptonate aldolase [Sphaerochaeta pleomorpha str. Grapes]